MYISKGDRNIQINRFIALAAIALLVAGAMGVISYKAFDQTDQLSAATDCNGQDDDFAEAVETEYIDDVEQECGPQDEALDEADEVAPASKPVTADEAQAIAETANPGAATLNVKFDRENGKDIWEIELDNGLDVKVDAASGAILLTKNRD